MGATKLPYARAPRVNFSYLSAHLVSSISPMSICIEAVIDVIYRILEAPHRLCFGSEAAIPPLHMPRGRGRPHRDKLVALSEFL